MRQRQTRAARGLQIDDVGQHRARARSSSTDRDKEEKFAELCLKRMAIVEKALQEFGQLGDKDYYKFTEDDRIAIVAHLKELVEVVDQKFKTRTNVGTSFRLPSQRGKTGEPDEE